MFGFLGRRVKKTAKTFSRWAEVPLLKRLYLYTKGIFVNLFIRNKNVEIPSETFEEAIKRMGLTEAQLQERLKMFKAQMLIYGIGTLGVSLYLAYLLSASHWISAIITFLIMMVLLLNALRSHFWIFQIKQRKLGCTLQEWLNSSIKESK